MVICDQETTVCYNYCRVVPALKAEWRQHFGVVDWDKEVESKAKEKDNIESKAMEKIVNAFQQKDYAEARKCAEHLITYIECCEYFK